MKFSSTCLAALLACLVSLAGCGLFYQAGTRIKAARMADNLQTGEPMVEVHNKYGEPDIRQYPSNNTEIWSYPSHTNTNDVTASLLYTSSKEGDTGMFLDLKFVDGKLVSWSEAQHTMPPKQGTTFGAGFGAPPVSAPAGAHY